MPMPMRSKRKRTSVMRATMAMWMILNWRQSNVYSVNDELRDEGVNLREERKANSGRRMRLQRRPLLAQPGERYAVHCPAHYRLRPLEASMVRRIDWPD